MVETDCNSAQRCRTVGIIPPYVLTIFHPIVATQIVWNTKTLEAISPAHTARKTKRPWAEVFEDVLQHRCWDVSKGTFLSFTLKL